MGAERIVGTAENRKYHRASVLWPANLLCRSNSFECVIFNISANGAKVMIKNSLGIRFILEPELVAKMLGDKLPLLPPGSDGTA